MNRKEFGKLIIALRREHLDRYLKPWTRQQFAEECGKLSKGYLVDEEVLTGIENGRRALSPEILVILADALKLTSGERKEFYLAASGVDDEDIYQQYDDTKRTLKNLLLIMGKLQSPAFLADQYWDIVAVNQLLMESYNVDTEDFLSPDANPATRFNMMRVLFSPEFDEQKKALRDRWDKFASNTVTLFRASTLRYRATEYFQFLYPQLCELDDFRAYIQYPIKPNDDNFIGNMFITLNNPHYGQIQTVTTSLIVATPSGELEISTFTPLNKETVQIFTDMCEQGNPVFTLLPDWPDKNIIIQK